MTEEQRRLNTLAAGKVTYIDASPAGAGPRCSGKSGTASISVRLQGRTNASSATKPYAEDAKSRSMSAKEMRYIGGARCVFVDVEKRQSCKEPKLQSANDAECQSGKVPKLQSAKAAKCCKVAK